MIKKIHILGIILASVLLMSCIEERLKADDTENAAAYLQVRGGRLLNSTVHLTTRSRDFGFLHLIKVQGDA